MFLSSLVPSVCTDNNNYLNSWSVKPQKLWLIIYGLNKGECKLNRGANVEVFNPFSTGTHFNMSFVYD